MTKNNPDPYGLTRRRFLQVSGGALGGLVVAACGNGATTTTLAPTTPTTAGSTTTGGVATTGGATTTTGVVIPQSDFTEPLHFAYETPNISLQAAHWVGIQKGWFEEVGIDLRPENVSQPDDTLTPFLTGDPQIALFDASVLFPAEAKAVADGNPTGLTWVGCVLGAQPLIMIANEGITAEGLAGKKVGGARAGTTNEALCRYMLDQMGYNWETDVEFVNLPGGSNDWVTAMLQGTVDATIAFPRHIAVAEEAKGSAIFTGSRPDPQAGWGVLRSTIDKYPNFVAAWSYAYIKSAQWMQDPNNWEEAREIIVNDLGLDYPDNAFDALPIDMGIMTSDLGWSPDLMDQWLEFLRPFSEFPADMPWRDYVDLTGLHTAQAAHGLPNNPVDVNTGVTNLGNGTTEGA